MVSDAHSLAPIVRLCRSRYDPACDNICRRARRCRSAPADGSARRWPMGRPDRGHSLPNDGISVRQPVLHADRRSFSFRDDLGHDRHSRHDPTRDAVVARECRDGIVDGIGHRDADGRHHHPRLSLRRDGVVRPGVLDAPARPAAAIPFCNGGALWDGRHHRVADRHCTVAVAADRQSARAVQNRARAFC